MDLLEILARGGDPSEIAVKDEPKAVIEVSSDEEEEQESDTKELAIPQPIKARSGREIRRPAR